VCYGYPRLYAKNGSALEDILDIFGRTEDHVGHLLGVDPAELVE
jgi:hypothetical protein